MDMTKGNPGAEAEIRALLRENIRNIVPYSTARDDCKVKMDVYLDANENPFESGVNRYPSPHQNELKKMLSVLKKVPVRNIFLGNGSDEPIDLVFRLFCPPGESSMVQIVPTYGMYSVAAAINDVRVINSPLEDGFRLDAGALLDRVEPDTRVIFLCSPNNPTGNLLDRGEVRKILDSFSGITVVDEAYIDFAETESFTEILNEYPRLIVLQTLSKAWGMAGLRIGLAMADEYITDVMSRVKYPYNISILNQKKAAELLEKPLEALDRVTEIIGGRQWLAEKISGLPQVKKVWPSDANFLLVEFDDKDRAFGDLIRGGVIVRDRSSAYGCHGCLRISVGTPEENARVLEILQGGESSIAGTASQEISSDSENIDGQSSASSRSASCFRKTRETTICVRVGLDEFRPPRVATGLNFFNHMLEQIGYHSGISLDVICFGDIETDDHHSVEDVAIALGDCLNSALGSKAGIGRYGFSLPMDEAEATVLMDLGGRIDFDWDVSFRCDRIGDVSAQMFEHFFKSMAEHMKCNLHVRATGRNDHHVIEGVFKAFARALKMAVSVEDGSGSVPSSKGVME